MPADRIGRASRWSDDANDLITLFLALELISIPTYILLYLPARTRSNQEAAAKYFLLSVMSSAVLLFGFSYLYGLTGSTNLTVIVDTLTKANAESKAAHAIPSPMALLAIVLVFAALAFRVTVVPFHFYAPDVYEGGPAGSRGAARGAAEDRGVRRAGSRARATRL